MRISTLRSMVGKSKVNKSWEHLISKYWQTDQILAKIFVQVLSIGWPSGQNTLLYWWVSQTMLFRCNIYPSLWELLIIILVGRSVNNIENEDQIIWVPSTHCNTFGMFYPHSLHQSDDSWAHFINICLSVSVCNITLSSVIIYKHC